MPPVISAPLMNAVVMVGDWLLPFLQVLDGDLYQKTYQGLLHHLDEQKLEKGTFRLLLGHLEHVFEILQKVQTDGVLKLPVPSESESGACAVEMLKKIPETLRESTEFFTVLIALAAHFDLEEGSFENRGDVLMAFQQGSSFPEHRIRMMMELYNMLPEKSEYRFAVFVSICEFAKQVSRFEMILPYVDQLIDWMPSWQLTGDQKRNLFLILSNKLKEMNRPAQAYTFLKAYVEACNGEGEEVLSNANTVSAAVSLVEISIRQPGIFYFDGLLELAAISFLRHTEAAPLVSLLEIFLTGGVAEMEEFYRTKPEVFAAQGLDYAQCRNKIRLLQLASFAAPAAGARDSDLHLPSLSAKMQMSEAELEALVVEAIGQDLLDAKIDQVKKVVRVRSAMQREFGRGEWEDLKGRLTNWNTNTKQLLAILKGLKANGTEQVFSVSA